MIGWAAVTGSVDLVPLILFAIIFIWTPPHFWSLALWANDDYRRAGVPMLPVTNGAKETRWQIFIYTLILVPVSLAPVFVGVSVAFHEAGGDKDVPLHVCLLQQDLALLEEIGRAHV